MLGEQGFGSFKEISQTLMLMLWSMLQTRRSWAAEALMGQYIVRADQGYLKNANALGRQNGQMGFQQEKL
jgi:hypothetical protein